MDYRENHPEGKPLPQLLSGRVDRREFMRRAALVTGGSILSFSLLGGLACAPSAKLKGIPTLRGSDAIILLPGMCRKNN